MPWNPQRIEQRIGRCHRYGQKFDVVVVNFLNKKNAADQRVYQLLSEKFKLFDGVFGASDEVLGSIESSVDFEERIAQIYQTCRTEVEIHASFDALQKEMETQIDEKINLTRQKLLENFDEEVHEKLRVNLKESKEYLNKYEDWLWQITKYYLESYADFSPDGYSFTLRKNPFENERIIPGSYSMNRNYDGAYTYRIGHPLAQHIIEKCKSVSFAQQELIFNYSDSAKKISILESLIGKSGWLSMINLTIHSFETEDILLFCGISDEIEELDIEQCKRVFSLLASMNPSALYIPGTVKTHLNELARRQEKNILQINSERNAKFFDIEMGKLDKWAEDVKNSLELELKELDKEIKFRKTEAKKILNLEEKVKSQRQIKEMEKKRNDMRMNLYQSQDEIDDKKEKLINEIEARMKQRIEKNEIFCIRWKLI